MAVTHELKTHPPYFEAVERGEKTFEVRRDDRGFQKGDRMILAENAALRDERAFLIEQKEGAEDALFIGLTRATEAERKLAEAVRLLRRIDRTYADMQDGNGNHPTELRKVRAFLSKEGERG